MTEPSADVRIDPVSTLKKIEPEFSRGQLESGLDRLHRTRRRRTALRGGLAVAAVAALAFGTWASWPTVKVESVAERVVEPPSEPGVMALPDGSEVFLDEDAEVRIEENRPELQRLTLVQGGAQFEVVPNSERTFRVEIGDVTVEVLGTSFHLTLLPDERVRVDVERGRVRVEWPDGSSTLSRGDGGVYPPPREVSVHPTASSKAPPPSPRELSHTRWQDRAERGEFDEARHLLERAGRTAVRDEVDELMLAADVQRYSGHPAAALPYLERVTRRHTDDARAGLAAFTSGRILFERLGRPREAAEAFALSRRLEPSGSLAEDALAREADAWGRAGVSAEAQRCAQEYRTRFPNGRRAETMAQWLEASH